MANLETMFCLGQRVCRFIWRDGQPFLQFGTVTRVTSRTYYVDGAKKPSQWWCANVDDAIRDWDLTYSSARPKRRHKMDQHPLRTFYAFEVATDSAYEIYVNIDKAVVDEHLNDLKQFHERPEIEPIETIAIGTVEAMTVGGAQDKIRKGDWEVRYDVATRK